MSWPDDGLPRFVVASLTGSHIDPRTVSHKASGHPLPTSYYVQDRAYCFRVVAAFEALPLAGGGAVVKGGTHDERRRRQAEAACAELNARDAAA